MSTLWSALIEEYTPNIRAYGMRFTTCPHMLDDLIQEVAIKLGSVAEKVKDDDNAELALRAQLLKIVRNTFLDMRKSRATRAMLSSEEVSEKIDESQLQNQVKSDSFDALNQAISRLNDERQNVLRLRLSGLTQSQVANRIGVSQKTVSNIETESIRLIRQDIGEDNLVF